MDQIIFRLNPDLSPGEAAYSKSLPAHPLQPSMFHYTKHEGILNVK